MTQKLSTAFPVSQEEHKSSKDKLCAMTVQLVDSWKKLFRMWSARSVEQEGTKMKYRNQTAKLAAQASGATKSTLSQRQYVQSVIQEGIHPLKVQH